MKHQDIQGLLRDLKSGKLTAGEAAILNKHLADDPDLTNFLEFVDWLEPRLGQLATMGSNTHPSGQELVTAALGPLAELSGDNNSEVATHIAGCSECQELVAAVSEAAAEPISRPDSRPTPRPAWQKAALAAVLSLVVIGGGFFLGRQASVSRPEPVRLAALTRSVTDTPTITALAGHKIPPLLLALDPWIGRTDTHNYNMQVQLFTADEPDPVWPSLILSSRNWQADAGGILARWQEGDLPQGLYRVEVRDDHDQVIFASRFRLLPPAE